MAETALSASPVRGLERLPARPTKVGLVAGGLGAYWPQFPDLLPQLQRSARRVAERLGQLDVAHGPVTAFGIGQLRDGSFGFIASEGEVVSGPLLQIGNTTSRVDFGRNPGEWTDEWSASGIGHHWALGTGHRAGELRAVADLLEIEFHEVGR
nr:hypothetical protein [Jiangella aurantiaca]